MWGEKPCHIQKIAFYGTPPHLNGLCSNRECKDRGSRRQDRKNHGRSRCWTGGNHKDGKTWIFSCVSQEYKRTVLKARGGWPHYTTIIVQSHVASDSKLVDLSGWFGIFQVAGRINILYLYGLLLHCILECHAQHIDLLIEHLWHGKSCGKRQCIDGVAHSMWVCYAGGPHSRFSSSQSLQ